MAALSESQKQLQSQLHVPTWVSTFIELGVQPNMIRMIIAQLALESNYFTSNAYKINKNPGGITWNNNYRNRPGASVGIKRPAKEGGNYVNFDSYKSAAKDYIRILSKTGVMGKPIDATDLIDFAKKLKANGYYADQLDHYYNMLFSQYKRLDNFVDYASLFKKKSSLNMATISPVIIGIALGMIFLKKIKFG